MLRRRIAITIEVDCDPIPGAAHEPADWVAHFEHNVFRAFSHYDPKVTGVTDVDLFPDGFTHSNDCVVESTDERMT